MLFHPGSRRVRAPEDTVPPQVFSAYSSIYDVRRVALRPTLLRRLGEALVSLADARDVARQERRYRSGSPQAVPDYLREDVGLPPAPDYLGPWGLW